MFSLIYVWISGWVNNREAGDLKRYRVHYDVTEMKSLYRLDGFHTETPPGLVILRKQVEIKFYLSMP